MDASQSIVVLHTCSHCGGRADIEFLIGDDPRTAGVHRQEWTCPCCRAVNVTRFAGAIGWVSTCRGGAPAHDAPTSS